jgi:uncharacterized protein YkwD
MRRLGVTRTLVLLTLVLTVGLATICAIAEAASARALHLTAAERAVIRLVNESRAEHGLRPLKVSTPLCRAARAHSAEMLSRGFFSHLSYNGESQSARVARFGYALKGRTSWSTGEVIGYGTGTAGTPQAIVTAWLQSKPHRDVLLNPSVRDVGVGRASGVFCGSSGAAVYTLDLGRRTG